MNKKDPAFLFYSKDFYEGTRTMLPEERACYIDLLIYQHQNDFIPNDLKRLLMYCSGVDEATLQATLQAKFKLTDKGWTNLKLDGVISDRTKFKGKLSINGTVGQFWKKTKAILSNKEYEAIRKLLKNSSNEEIFEFIKDKEINNSTLKASLKALLKHLAIGNVIEDVDKESSLGIGPKKFQKPTIQEISEYCTERKNTIDANVFFDFYESKDWKIGSNRMKDWKACVRTWEKNRTNEKKSTPTFDINR